MDLDVQAEEVQSGQQELALWLAGHGIPNVHVHLSQVRACFLRCSALLSAWVRQDARSEASRH